MDTTRTSLLARVKNPHDKAAWIEFDAIYRPVLAHYAAARGLAAADVDDVVQYCMTKLFEKLPTFEYDRGKSFRGFLRTVVNNRIRSLYRERRELQAKTAVLGGVADDDDTPDETLDRLCHQEELRYCLKLVAGEFKTAEVEIFRMRYFNEASTEQTCEKFGVQREYVDKLGWRIRKRLREVWQERHGEGAA